MKIRFFKIAIALLVIFISVYFLNKTILQGDKEKISLLIKVIDNKTEIPLIGMNISVTEEKTPFKIPFPGTIMKEYHIIYNVESDTLGEAASSRKMVVIFSDFTKSMRSCSFFGVGSPSWKGPSMAF